MATGRRPWRRISQPLICTAMMVATSRKEMAGWISSRDQPSPSCSGRTREPKEYNGTTETEVPIPNSERIRIRQPWRNSVRSIASEGADFGWDCDIWKLHSALVVFPDSIQRKAINDTCLFIAFSVISSALVKSDIGLDSIPGALGHPLITQAVLENAPYRTAR